MTLRLQLKQRQLAELSTEYEHKASTALRKIIPGDTSRRRLELSREVARGGQLLGALQDTLIQLQALSEKLQTDRSSLRQLTEQLQATPQTNSRGKEDSVVRKYQQRTAQLLTEAQPELELALQQLQQEIMSLGSSNVEAESATSSPLTPSSVTPAAPSAQGTTPEINSPIDRRWSLRSISEAPEGVPGAPPRYCSGVDVTTSIERLGLYPQIEASPKDSQHCA